jgi:aspartate kinase
MSGTTDTLLGYADATSGRKGLTRTGATREGSLAELYRTLAERHLLAAREVVSPEHLPAVEERLRAQLADLVEAFDGLQENPAARRARIAVHGERLSAEIVAGALKSLGVPAAVVERDPIATDSSFDGAEVDAAETRSRCSRFVAPLLEGGAVAVVPGYVGRSPDGLETTLGRGGSDLSATVVGRALEAGEVWIMSDVDGVLDADPRLVPEAAAVICIGSPAAGDLERGQRCLREKGIAPLHAGSAAAGLVFIVFADAAEEALRALHSGLLSTAAEAVA